MSGKEMPLTIAPNESTQPDFTIWYTADDGLKIRVGRVFHASAGVWCWSMASDQREGRTPPHQGYAADEETATRAWKRCWESAEAALNWPLTILHDAVEGGL